MTDAELFMAMRASFKEAEAFVEAAADRIEAQAAEIERLRDALAKAKGMALEECPFRYGTGGYNDWWHHRRTTLAELKGESHE